MEENKIVKCYNISGADPGFQVRGGGGGALKNITPKNHIFSNCGGRRKNFWGISCEKLYIIKYYIKHSSP